MLQIWRIVSLFAWKAAAVIRFDNYESSRTFNAGTTRAALCCQDVQLHRIVARVVPVVMQGLDWDVGAIGNAEWAGARLSDVLKVPPPAVWA